VRRETPGVLLLLLLRYQQIHLRKVVGGERAHVRIYFLRRLQAQMPPSTARIATANPPNNAGDGAGLAGGVSLPPTVGKTTVGPGVDVGAGVRAAADVTVGAAVAFGAACGRTNTAAVRAGTLNAPLAESNVEVFITGSTEFF